MRRKLNFPEAGNVLSEVFDVFYRGKHTGANNAAVLTDNNNERQNVSFAFLDEVVGKTIYNLTDGSSGTIISVTANTITATLAGGTDNDWDKKDEYVVGERALNVLSTPVGVPLPPASQPAPDGYATIGDGRQITTVAGTAKALAGATSCKRVEVQALFSNTQRLAVGGSTVVEAVGSERGYILLPGSNKTFFVEDLADIYIDVQVSTEGVSFTYYE